MGAGAVSGTASHEDNKCSLSAESQKTMKTTMSCEVCSTSFNLFKKKKACSDCGKNHCGDCLIKEPWGSSVRRRCKKCRLLTSGKFTRADLMNFKAKELLVFIQRRSIPTHGVTEKTDLVEILLQVSNNPEYREQEAANIRHLRQLEERKRHLDLESRRTGVSGQEGANEASPSDSPSTHTPGLNTPGSSTPSEDSSVEMRDDSPSAGTGEGGAGPPSYRPPPPYSRSPVPEELAPEPSNTGSANLSEGQAPPAAPEPPSVPQPASETGGGSSAAGPTSMDTGSAENSPKTTHRRKATLEQVNLVTDLEDLTVRQLKEILASNFVDYKGCCEKWELVERASRLWHSNKTAKISCESNANSSVEDPDSNICKICMDAPIDCVLLDCGHMVTCTTCGKQMSECPICRQFVVRVVHVFKA